MKRCLWPVLALCVWSWPVQAQQVQVMTPAHYGITGPLRQLRVPDGPPPQRRIPPHENRYELWQRLNGQVQSPQGPDPVWQQQTGELLAPTPVVSFAGVGNNDNAVSVVPPDISGEVGPNHYVQMVNLEYAVWDRSGNLLLGPLPNNTIWSTLTSGACDQDNDGDPVVLYDHLADRWFLSQFAVTSGTNSLCIAVSQTSDPTGAFFLYEFQFSDFPDYPKFGVWPDAYYVTTHRFGGSTYVGQMAGALERAAMLAGDPTARLIFFDLDLEIPGAPGSSLIGMIPPDLDGPAPTGGTPAPFLIAETPEFHGAPADQIQVYEFDVDFTTPANSTFTLASTLGMAAVDMNLCNFSQSCIPQPSTSRELDPLSGFTMFRAPFRHFATGPLAGNSVLLGNFSVDANAADLAGIRWFELRNTGSGWSLFQEGTFAPDTEHRWMGSIAMNANGDIALGYSTSSTSVRPSIRYTGRLFGDTPGIMTLEEGELFTGAGSQTSQSRWGDYSQMAVDPTDDLTFWYTNEHIAAAGGINWRTHIGAFVLDSSVPEIELSPTALTATTAPGTSTTETLTISNTGTSDLTFALTPAIEPLRPQVQASRRTVSAAEAARRGPTQPPGTPRQAPSATELVQDGGFEAGVPNTFWGETSTNFGTPLCDLSSCGSGGGTGPRTGDFWAWFGGSSAVETGTLDQNVTIPEGIATLSFFLEIPTANTTGFLRVEMDGDILYEATEADEAAFATYVQVVLDVSAYADGGAHTLRFNSTTNGGGILNFFVDDVSLVQDDPIWLSATPLTGTIPAGDSQDITVTFDATDLSVGTYTGTLTIVSNDADEPSVEVPVTFEVGSTTPFITVTSPNGGESFTTGTIQTITWTDNLPGNVALVLTQNNLAFKTLATSTESDGSFSWAIGDEVPPGSDYKIRVTSKDDTALKDNSDAFFSVSAGPPTITVLSPNGGESFDLGQSITLSWLDNIASNVAINLLKGGTVLRNISPDTPSDGSHTWTVPGDLTPATNYKIRVTNLADLNHKDNSDANFSIVSGATSYVGVLSPNGGEVFTMGQSVPITWQSNMGGNVLIRLLQNNLVLRDIVASTENDGAFDWVVPTDLVAGSTYKVRVTSLLNTLIKDQSNVDFTINAVGGPSGGPVAGGPVAGGPVAGAPVGGKAGAEVPGEYSLAGSYPNPFNPVSVIRYGLPEQAAVSLVVYDVLGRVVAHLVEGVQQAGWHEAVFDGSLLPSGVYLYRLEAGTFTRSRTMLLVK